MAHPVHRKRVKPILVGSNIDSRVVLPGHEDLVLLYVQEVVTQPKILNRTILYNLVHVT